MELCAYIMVKDGACNLRHTLPALKKQVKYIYVVDTGSSDDTVEICKQYANHVHEIKTSGNNWNFNIAEVRNNAMDHACSLFPDFDYFLWIDHDECFSPRFFDKLGSIDMDGYQGIDTSRIVLTFLREDGIIKAKWFDGHHTGNGWIDRQQRIYQKHLRFDRQSKAQVLHRRVNVRKRFQIKEFNHWHFNMGLTLRAAKHAHARGISNEDWLKIRWTRPDFKLLDYSPYPSVSELIGIDLEAMYNEFINLKF